MPLYYGIEDWTMKAKHEIRIAAEKAKFMDLNVRMG
jgi:hypothetical protein